MASEGKQKKPNFFVRAVSKIGGFFRGIMAELKKVTWPTKKQVLVNTLSVLAFCLVVGLIIFLCDSGMKALMALISRWS